MNIFILTDLEGISGVTSIKCIDPSTDDYAYACRKLEESINLASEVCRKNGAENIYYLDGHGGGGNINPENIVPYAIKADIREWQKLISGGKIDFQIELGSHARAGTLGGFLDHTISSARWFSYKINGKEFSELGIHAVFCGAYGVPIAMCSGDETACAQAKEYVPEIITAPVKKAKCRNMCFDYPDADKILGDAIVKAIKNYKEIKPLSISYPANIELTYYRSDMCEEDLSKCTGNAVRVGARTLKKTILKTASYENLKF